MNVYFSQVYVEPGEQFPFSYKFQEFLGDVISSVITPSQDFLNRFGNHFNLAIYISAKSGIDAPLIKGPGVFRRTKDVEFTVFIPYLKSFDCVDERIKLALHHLFEGILEILGILKMENDKVVARETEIIMDIIHNK